MSVRMFPDGHCGLRQIVFAVPHDIFVSYSAKDKVTADAICRGLEASGICCWIAPRDVLPGIHYGEAIIEALNNSRIFLLVFSAHSNSSAQVLREVERAASKGLPVLPLCIEAVPLSPAIEYFISSPHRLEALHPPIEHYIPVLTKAVNSLLSHHSGHAARLDDLPAATAPRNIPPGLVTADASEITSVHYGDWAELAFSLTNQSPKVQKVTSLFLEVEERGEIDMIRLKKAGAILKEFQLSAKIGDENLVDLISLSGVQIMLNPHETEAFRLKIEAPEGYRYKCKILADFMDIETGEKRELSSRLVQIEFPIRNVVTLRSRRARM